MAVDTNHAGYDKAKDAWELVRDTGFGGGRAVKAKGAKYLPMLPGQDLTKYDTYKQRANFFNIVKRTLSAFVGFIFTNNPEIDVGKAPSPNIKAFQKDCTLSGKTFYDYIKQTTRDVVSVGRRGTLIEWANPALENRPFLVEYETENIINWRYEMVNGKRMLTLLVLKEKSEIPNDTDPYQSDCVYRYRVIELKRDGANGPLYVRVKVWEKNTKGEWSEVDQGFPERKTESLTEIPFVFHNTQGDEADPCDVPLDDMAGINISHYMNSADLEQGRHLCGQPTLLLMGFSPDDDYFLGSSKAIVTNDKDAKGSFLQIDANSLSALSTGIEEKERQMAAMGARMLEKQASGKGQEAFETVQIRQSGETSALTDIAIACSETLSKVLRLVVWWDDRTVDSPDALASDPNDPKSKGVHVELNTEFTASTLDAPMLTQLTSMMQTGALSYKEYFFKMQKGGIISPEKTEAEERKDLADGPMGTPLAIDGPQPLPAPPGAGKKPAVTAGGKGGGKAGGAAGATGKAAGAKPGAGGGGGY